MPPVRRLLPPLPSAVRPWSRPVRLPAPPPPPPAASPPPPSLGHRRGTHRRRHRRSRWCRRRPSAAAAPPMSGVAVATPAARGRASGGASRRARGSGSGALDRSRPARRRAGRRPVPPAGRALRGRQPGPRVPHRAGHAGAGQRRRHGQLRRARGRCAARHAGPRRRGPHELLLPRHCRGRGRPAGRPGRRLGTAGARLHFGARIGGAYFDPAALFAATVTEVELLPLEVAARRQAGDAGAQARRAGPRLACRGSARALSLLGGGRRGSCGWARRRPTPWRDGLRTAGDLADRLLFPGPCSRGPAAVRPAAGAAAGGRHGGRARLVQRVGRHRRPPARRPRLRPRPGGAVQLRRGAHAGHRCARSPASTPATTARPTPRATSWWRPAASPTWCARWRRPIRRRPSTSTPTRSAAW